MTAHVMIPVGDLLAELEGRLPCQDCAAGLGVHVEDGLWEVVQLHSIPCRATAKRTTLRLVDTDSDLRCRRCGKLLSHDIGGSVFGEVVGEELCIDCDPRPSTWETL